MLDCVASKIPELYKFCHLAYGAPTSLQFGDGVIWSTEGVQQGDPMGPLLFCLVLHPILISMKSSFKIGFMDDVTLGGDIACVANDVELMSAQGIMVGLELNHAKCELVHSSLKVDEMLNSSHSNSYAIVHQCSDLSVGEDFKIWQFPLTVPEEACLLGAPILMGPAMDKILAKRCTELERVLSRLELLAAQDALLILRTAFGSPKMLNVLRSSPCAEHDTLNKFDSLLRSGISSITNCVLNDTAWMQASLPIKDGGLGIRSVVMLAPSAFFIISGIHTTSPVCHPWL